MEQKWNYVYQAETSLCCHQSQQLVMRVQKPLPSGWMLHENYCKLRPRSYDELAEVLCEDPYYITIPIRLKQQEDKDAIPLTDVTLDVEVLAQQDNEDRDEKSHQMCIQAWRPEATKNRSHESDGITVASHDVFQEFTRVEAEDCKERNRKGQRGEQSQLVENTMLQQTATTVTHIMQAGEDPVASTMQSTGEAAADLIVHELQPRFSSYITTTANKVRKSASLLGGFWLEWSDIPIDVLHKVCSLAAERLHVFADHLRVSKMDIVEKQKSETAAQAVRQIMEIWVRREGRNATLDVLFTVLESMDLLGGLVASLKPLVGNAAEQT